MGWQSAHSFFTDLADREEALEERRRAESLERVRRRVEHQAAADRVLARVEASDAEQASRVPNWREHELAIVPTQRPGWARMHRATCSCGWQARQSAYTEAWAERSWKGHVERVLRLREAAS